MRSVVNRAEETMKGPENEERSVSEALKELKFPYPNIFSIIIIF